MLHLAVYLTTGTLPPLPLNDLLILAGTLHGIHAITARLDPAPPPGAPPAGLQSFEAEGWGGTVFLTPTGEFLSERDEATRSGSRRRPTSGALLLLTHCRASSAHVQLRNTRI